jgi:predicted GNAT family N-acyltransferase
VAERCRLGPARGLERRTNVTRLTIRVLPWHEAAPEAFRIRDAVFVQEQGVPASIELDEWDERCDHVLAFDDRGAAVGTGRLLPDGRIGRMAVLRDRRGSGIGSAILAALLERARSRGLPRVELHAQRHAVPFYRRHGFVPVGDEFIEAGIPHVLMTRDVAGPDATG